MIQTTRRELDVSIDTRSLAPLREFVREVLAEAHLPPGASRQVVIAIDEACSSIILNAKEHGATGNLQLTLDIDATRVKIRVSDTANEYEMGDISREELLKEFARGKQNELGTFLIRRVMDEFTYVFRKGFQSQIEMIKFLYDEQPQAN